MRTSVDNPFDGVTPNFTAFGVEFQSLWQVILGGLWGVFFVIAAGALLMGFMKLSTAGKQQNTRDAEDGKHQVKMAALALGGLAAAPLLVGAVLFIVGSAG